MSRLSKRPTMIRSLRAALTGASLAVLACVTLAGPAPAPAQAQQRQPGAEERIAAVVNEQAITLSDVLGRLQLALVSSGLPDSPEARQRLLPQVLRLLIDETLQRQEAKRLNIAVTETEIEAELRQIAQRNRLSVDQFQDALRQAGVPISTLRQQVEANLAWSRLVQRRVRPTIQIGDDEINAFAERIRANAGKPEYLVSEIFLAVDDDANEAEVARLAERLVEQIGQGASFPAVAQQFSQSAGAAAGGDLGWVQQGQLEQSIDETLRQLRPGQFSRPVRGINGFHILWMRDLRAVAAGDPGNIQISIGQLVLPAPDPSREAAMMDLGRQLVAEMSSCEALQAAGNRVEGAQVAAIPLTRVADIPEQLRNLVSNLGVGQSTQPLRTDQGVMILMVCEREVPPGSLPPRDQIANILGGERLDMLQRRYLRDLRRQAFVDVRV